jgi:hypothetical protein
MLRRVALIAALSLTLPPLVAATSEEPVDWAVMSQIRDEGLNRSQVMETLGQLTDVIGPRLTGSPGMKQANDWTREQLEKWGLANAHLEAWGPFGRGWSYSHARVQMVAPSESPLVAYPKAWTPGTAGKARGKAVKAKLAKAEDLEPWKGKLAGAIVFLNDARELAPPESPLFRRNSEKDLEEIAAFPIPGARRAGERMGPPERPNREEILRRTRFQKALREFLKNENALATVEVSERDGGIVRVGGGGSREPGEDPGVTGLVMAAEHYNRVARLLDRKMAVELEIDVAARFHDEDRMAYNTIAEIPGTDKKAEVVVVGAHLDSWHAGTGATDNASGSAVVMEAVRILKALDLKPRRTIRVALWSGEEQGLLGSRAYVKEHLASRPDPKPEEADVPSFMRREAGPLTLKPGHARFAAYFNLDNGTGRIRGIYAQQNAAARPIFEAWLEPFHDLGAKTVTLRNTGGTDHQAFDAVGLPGFQFIQDPGDYMTRAHHTHMDVYDRVQREDLMQASVVMAAFAWNAATRDELFPRKPLPKDAQPAPSEPAKKPAKK